MAKKKQPKQNTKQGTLTQRFLERKKEKAKQEKKAAALFKKTKVETTTNKEKTNQSKKPAFSFLKKITEKRQVDQTKKSTDDNKDKVKIKRPGVIIFLTSIFFSFGLVGVIQSLFMLFMGAGFLNPPRVDKLIPEGAPFPLVIITALGIILLTMSLIQIFIAWGLWSLKNWARIGGIVLSVVWMVAIIVLSTIWILTILLIPIGILFIYLLMKKSTKYTFIPGAKPVNEITTTSTSVKANRTISEQKEHTSLKEFFSSLFTKKPVNQENVTGAQAHSFYKDKLKKIKKKHKPLSPERKHQLRFYLDKAGINTQPSIINKRIFNVSIGICLLFTIYLLYGFATGRGYIISDIVITLLFTWTVLFLGSIAIMWVLFYFVLDLRIYKRKSEIEDVLPDYLQLTASNIKAGMTIDRALWYAVRPRFGVLANEIEVVAKETMRGDDLKAALKKFADKYESPILKRAISLLIEGIESGGEIGTLLNKISINIQENKIMKREMAANVTTYVIFISFATIAAAPALFGLSGVLIKVISSIGSTLEGNTAASGFILSFSGDSITYSDFKFFAMTSLIITSIFSSIIIATIMKGNAREGVKYIPLFIVVTITIFLAADFILSQFFGFIIE